MKKKLDALMALPWVAHILRAWTRFGNRLGNQFAAAITYFSVLALVPIIMFAFSMLGMTLTTLRPDMLEGITDKLVQQLGDAGAGKKIGDLMEEYLRNWRAVGLFGLLSLLYAGSGWVGNLRAAVQAQWRPEFEHKEDDRNIILQTLSNMGVLIVLLLGVLLSFSVTIAGTTMTGRVSDWIGLGDLPGGGLLLRLIAFLLTVAASWVLFMLIYSVLPEDYNVNKAKMVGSLIAAILFALLQMVTGQLMDVFTKNKAAALFGPVIVMMLFMNVFARVILLVASWIATTKQPAVAFHYNACDEPLRDDRDLDAAPDHWKLADEERAQQEADKLTEERKAKEDEERGYSEPDNTHRPQASYVMSRPRTADRVARPKVLGLDEYPKPDPNRLVSEPVAARSVKAGMKAGYTVGAATGIGVGALVAAVLGKLRR